MPRPRNVSPTYTIHKQSGRGRLIWYDTTGARQQKLLPGQFGSEESLVAKARLELELVASPTVAPVDPETLTVAEVLVAYLDFAERHYRDQVGNLTDEVRHLKATIRHVREMYGDAPATEFGPLALKAVRQKFVELKWCRKTVNARVERIRRIFKWAVAEELVPPSVYQALAAVSGLQRGRTPARESESVGPVDDAVVDATLVHLNRHVRGLVEFQRLTGCRPGEAMALRRCDIDMSGAIWLYKPETHKTEWKGKTRTIAIGPKGQALLKQFLTFNSADHLFSPKGAVEELCAERSARRQTPRYPSHMARNESKRVGEKRRRPPRNRYERQSYLTAIERACDRAFPLVGELARRPKESVAKWWARLSSEQHDAVKAWRKSHRWHPNQLRHSYATKVRKAHGLEAAQVLLGHSRADVTQVYAERDEELAVTVAAKIG
jgi:integrase